MIDGTSRPTFGAPERENARRLIDLALAEDLAEAGDLTSQALIPEEARATARFVAREAGVLAGMPVVAMILERAGGIDPWQPAIEDGAPLESNSLLAQVSGSLRSLLRIERTALNFLQRLSGIATQTARFVAAVQGTRAVILDTRKTTPGWRVLEKYAVRCGGGTNHRMGLYDAVLIKDNHLAGLADEADPIATAVARARAQTPPGTPVTIEVDTLGQFDRALASRPEIILTDNFPPEELAEAVRRRDLHHPEVLIEISGGVTLATVERLARTGVDRISIGALTHSARALDLALDLGPPHEP